MKDTYSVRDLQRDTAGALDTAAAGALVTITRNDRPVAHLISRERMGALLETMELLADPKFMAALKQERAGKGKYYPASSLED